MNRARLIKRGATSDKKSAETISTKPAAKTIVTVVKEWRDKRRAESQTAARQAFSQLFT